MVRWLVFGALTTAALALADTPKAVPPGERPESKKMVELFAGSWSVDGSFVTPEMKEPGRWKMTANCSKVAAGYGVYCNVQGNNIVLDCFLAHDTNAGTGVHLMCVTSGGEIHDHKGVWKDKTIEFEPFPYKMQNKQVIESVVITTPKPNAWTLKAVTTGPGMAETVEFVFTRK